MQEEQSKNHYQRWFVFDYYTYAGAPKMEDVLMLYAKRHFLHCLIYEDDIKNVVSNIKAAQAKLREKNRRLKDVEVKSYHFRPEDDITWIYIGKQNIRLRRVVKEIECVDPGSPYRIEEEV